MSERMERMLYKMDNCQRGVKGMIIDYHVHLEEGPYSFRWLERTSKAIDHLQQRKSRERFQGKD